jgi:hypothetical protein
MIESRLNRLGSETGLDSIISMSIMCWLMHQILAVATFCLRMIGSIETLQLLRSSREKLLTGKNRNLLILEGKYILSINL